LKTHADRRSKAVAIISSDPLIAALVGAAVELIGYRAAFPRANESGAETVRRTRPAFVLLDCDDLTSVDDAFLGRTLMTGARLFVFGSEAGVEAHAALAVRYGMASIVFPRDVDALHSILSRRRSPQDVRARSLE
jgi:hypothetical protein